MIFVVSVTAYTPDTFDDIQSVLEGDYTPDVYTIIQSDLSDLSTPLNITWIAPTANDNHSQYSWKNYTFNITCSDASCGNVNVTLDPEEVLTYTPSTKIYCDDGKCTQKFYSGTQFGYEDNTWKELKDLRSFKGTTPINCVVISDNIHGVECLDYNLTHKKLKLYILDEKLINEEVKLKFSDNTKKEMIYSFKDKEQYTELWVESGMYEEIHFGENSTVIKLDDPNSDIMDDTYVEAVNPTSKYGTFSDMYLYGRSISGNMCKRGYIRINISSIPSNVVIDSANFSGYVGLADSDMTDAGMYLINGTTWTEEGMNWNTQPCGVLATLNSTYCSATPTDTIALTSTGSKFWDVTTDVSNEYSIGKNNISWIIKAVNEEKGTADTIWIDTKEDATAAQRPYLIISYSKIPKTIITNTAGAVPFYHNHTTINYECGDMNESDECIATFWVNATGNINDTYTFYATASSDSADSISSTSLNITIIEGGDSCSTNAWDCTENCIVNGLDAGGDVIRVTGSGTITIAGDITNCKQNGLSIINSGACLIKNKEGYNVC